MIALNQSDSLGPVFLFKREAFTRILCYFILP